MNKVVVLSWAQDFLKTHPGKSYFILVALCVIPYLAFLAMQDRQNTAAVFSFDEVVTDVKLLVYPDSVSVQYQDGTKIIADGLGIAVITKEDNQKAAERLKKADPKETDFPVVIFFNTTGFDATGDVRVVRRAKDGSMVWQQPALTAFVRAVVPQRDGSFKVIGHTLKIASRQTVTDEQFHQDYLGLETLKLPSTEELAKMSQAQLDKLGLVRMTKEEYDAKYGKEPPKNKETPKTKDEVKSTGLKGTIVRVGGLAVVPLSVPLYVLTGKVEPRDKIDPKDKIVAAYVVADKQGAFAITLPPGEYTVVALVEGRLRGNALNPKQWPSVKVGTDTWKDYEFRITN